MRGLSMVDVYFELDGCRDFVPYACKFCKAAAGERKH